MTTKCLPCESAHIVLDTDTVKLKVIVRRRYVLEYARTRNENGQQQTDIDP